MDSETASDFVKERSSGHNSCFGCDGEVDTSIIKPHVKTSSLSRLSESDRPSHILDSASSTLPSKLSSAQKFNQNLSEGLPKNTWYDPTESFSSDESSFDEKDTDEKLDQTRNHADTCSEDQFPEQQNIVCDELGDLAEHNGLDSMQAVDLSTINTDTQIFVRSSALDILAAFPKPETIVPLDGTSAQARFPTVAEDEAESSPATGENIDSTRLNGTFGDICKNEESVRSLLNNTEPCVVTPLSALASNEHHRDASSHKKPGVVSWSSTSDIDTRRRKKRLFPKGKRKMMYELSDDSGELGVGQPAVVSKANSTVSVASCEKVRPNGLKKNKQKTNSSALVNFFRGKSESKDETSKQKKAKKPVQKSKSFQSGSTSTAKNSQLNRMDSIRKLFKRPRESDSRTAVFADGESKGCLEISSPIVKTEFLSNNLVEREVILAQRDRAYQLGKKRLGRGEIDTEVDGDRPERPRTTVEIERFGCGQRDLEVDGGHSDGSEIRPNDGSYSEVVIVAAGGEQQESPIPPVRWKHLLRKRLSSTEIRGTSIDNINDNCSEEALRDPPNPEGPKMTANNDDDCGGNIGFDLNGNGVVLSTCEMLHVAETSQVDTKCGLDDNGNKTDAIIHVEPCSNDSSMVHQCQPVTVSEGTVDEAAACPSPPGIDIQGGPQEHFEEVFEDCKDDSELHSFHSCSIEETKSSVMPVVSNGTNRRWASEVSSKKSMDAIESAKKKTSQSFSGGLTSPSQCSGMAAFERTSTSEQTPPQKRSMSIFGKMASVKLEQSEPPTMVTDLVPTAFATISTDRRSQIVLELFTTERTYVRGLETMIELFKKPLLGGKIDEKEVDVLFSNINDIFAVNKDLLFLLWEKVKHWGNDQCIGQIFVDMEERFKIYAIFCKNFDKSDAIFKQKFKRNKDFERFLKTCYQDPLCQPGLDLPAYLITIVQRIPRYLLLLKNLCKKTPASHPDYNNLKQALSRMNKVAEYINSQLQEIHSQKAMQELRSTVIGLKAYEVKGRTLLKEGDVCLMSPKKLYKCLLFNDIMVFAVHGSKDRSEIEMTLELRTLWFEDLKKQDPQTNKCDAIELYTPHRPYTMYACSRMDKRVWLQKLRTAIVNVLYGTDCEDPDGMNISCRKASGTYIDGSVYCGEYLNGKRHGQGVMAWPNRTRYEGSWADDERHGQGQLTYYTGEKYVGGWVADKKDGEGKQTYVNGDEYCGQWNDGKMHGKGTIEFANGDRFVGEMQNNEVEGNGEMSCISGLVYKGEWHKSKRHGEGHLSFPNTNEYQGEMLNDYICGYGRMIYFNGDQYCGEWVNEMRHGIGNLKFVNGIVYDGQWNNDFMNGQGKMSYPNGDEYTGTWYQNKRIGKGQLMYAHGDTYNGQWQADVMHGKGVMYYKDGSVYEGNWERGERNTFGKITYCDKSVYEGEFRDGSRHGRGKLIYSNNVCYVGEWKSDKFDGNGIFSDPNTEYSYQGDWLCGKREGNGIEIFYRTRYEGSWKADMKHGAGSELSHAGHTFEGIWKENRKHGKGMRILRSMVKEDQQWHEGHLLEIAETVAEDLPPLPRR